MTSKDFYVTPLMILSRLQTTLSLTFFACGKRYLIQRVSADASFWHVHDGHGWLAFNTIPLINWLCEELKCDL